MPVRYVLNRVKRFVVYRILHVDDTPHRIALGVAIGIFVTWTPTIGAQMVLTVALCALFGANKVVGVPLAWISNPFTLVPVYVPSYWLGSALLRQERVDIIALLGKLCQNMAAGDLLSFFRGLWNAGVHVFVSVWLGSVIVGAALGALCYFLTRWGVIRYRRHWHRKHPARGPGGEPHLAEGTGD